MRCLITKPELNPTFMRTAAEQAPADRNLPRCPTWWSEYGPSDRDCKLHEHMGNSMRVVADRCHRKVTSTWVVPCGGCSSQSATATMTTTIAISSIGSEEIMRSSPIHGRLLVGQGQHRWAVSGSSPPTRLSSWLRGARPAEAAVFDQASLGQRT